MNSELFSKAEKLAEELKNNSVSTSQIRKFLAGINNLTNKISVKSDYKYEDLKKDLDYIKVKLAYQVGRAKGSSRDGLKKLYEEFDKRTDIIQKDNYLESFKDIAKFSEAIVAYHKYYGGKD